MQHTSNSSWSYMATYGNRNLSCVLTLQVLCFFLGKGLCVKSAVNGVESLCEIWRNADVSRIIPWGKHVCRGRIGDWCHGVGPDYGTFHGNQHIS